MKTMDNLLNILQSDLDTVLQKDVTYNLNGKVIKEGRIILFNIKDFYINFMLITKKQVTKNYEIPIPYDIKTTPNSLIFDYSVKHITKGSGEILRMITQLQTKVGKKSKFYDNILTIEFE